MAVNHLDQSYHYCTLSCLYVQLYTAIEIYVSLWCLIACWLIMIPPYLSITCVFLAFQLQFKGKILAIIEGTMNRKTESNWTKLESFHPIWYIWIFGYIFLGVVMGFSLCHVSYVDGLDDFHFNLAWSENLILKLRLVLTCGS